MDQVATCARQKKVIVQIALFQIKIIRILYVQAVHGGYIGMEVNVLDVKIIVVIAAS